MRRRVIRWFSRSRVLDAAAVADMLARENSKIFVDASFRIALIDRDVPSYFQSLEHLLRSRQAFRGPLLRALQSRELGIGNTRPLAACQPGDRCRSAIDRAILQRATPGRT